MIQILSIFAMIFALANTICIAMTLDQLEEHPLSPGSTTYAESPETIRTFKWNSPKQPVDLESFLGSCRHASYSSATINLSRSFSQKPKSKKGTTGVEAFIKVHFSQNPPKKAAIQSLAIQSLDNTDTIVPTVQNKKRTLTQASILSYATEEKQKEDSNSDNEGSTDAESLTYSDSFISYTSMTSTLGSDDNL